MPITELKDAQLYRKLSFEWWRQIRPESGEANYRKWRSPYPRPSGTTPTTLQTADIDTAW